jgi:hypothetical protein
MPHAIRRHGPLAGDALVIRPTPGWIRLVARSQPKRSWRARSVSWLITAVVAGVAVYVALNVKVDWLVILVCSLFVIGGTMAWLAQPGTLLYVDAGRVGQRTIIGSKYEVPASSLTAIRVSDLSVEGALLSTIVFDGHDGKPLMRHYNTRYDEGDLASLAARAGVTFVA